MSMNNLLRVTQMNALFFDKEINNVFWQHIQDFLKYLPPGLTSPFEPELKLVVKLATLSFSIFRLDRSFGQKLLQIQYLNLTPAKKALLLIGNCFEYFRIRFEWWKPSHDFNKTLANIHLVALIGSLLSFCVFLRTGEKPRLAERVLGLKQVYESENVRRHFDTKYMTRELLWNGLIEILIYILPLLNYHKIRRTIKQLNPFHTKPNVSGVSHRVMTIHSRCPHCEGFPILPHHMGCSHIFCYSCLKGNQMADSKYICPICEYTSSDNVCQMVQVMG